MRAKSKPRALTPDGPLSVIGYVRVSTTDQADTGTSLEAQRRAIVSECERRGWVLAQIVEDAGISGKSIKARPQLVAALTQLCDGAAHVLMAAKLDRLSRSVRDVCEVGERARDCGFALVVLDAMIDTSTPHGRAQLHMMATFAQLERELIGQRTREGLAARKATPGGWTSKSGRHCVQLGRPEAQTSAHARKVATAARMAGKSLAKIAEELTAGQVPTAQGGKRWYPSTVRALLEAQA